MNHLNKPTLTSKECDLAREPVFRKLPKESIDALRRICRVRTYRAGQTVIADQDEPGFTGCIAEGILRMQKTLPDGRQHIVGLLVAHDMFGRVLHRRSNFDIEAATDARLCCFDRRALEDLLSRDPALERLFLVNVLDELDAAREWIILLGCRRVSERLAAFLLILCRRSADAERVVSGSNDRIRVHVPIGRADLANYLGTRAETISRAVHALADEGIIAILDPHTFDILDLPGLIARAGNGDFGLNRP